DHGGAARRAARLRSRPLFQLSAALHHGGQGAAVQPARGPRQRAARTALRRRRCRDRARRGADFFLPPLIPVPVASPPLSTPWRARLETRLLLFVTLVTGAAVVA